jgi:hypothetical protein
MIDIFQMMKSTLSELAVDVKEVKQSFKDCEWSWFVAFHFHLDLALPSESAATVAATVVKYLKELKFDINFEARPGQTPILTNEQKNSLGELTHEPSYVKAITPIFEEIFSVNNLCVINSEDFPWLVTRGRPQKSDLFLAPNWVYTKRLPKNIEEFGTEAQVADSSSDARRFGTVLHTKLYDCVYILDCKIKNTEQAFGEFIIHMQHLNASSGTVDLISKGMFFGPFGCYLVICRGMTVMSREFVEWTHEGSLERLKEFFQSPKWDLTGLLGQHSLTIVEPQEEFETAFLGSGAFGRVVRTADTEGNVHALKVVRLENVMRLQKEYDILKAHRDHCGCLFIASIPRASQVRVFDQLCGFFLSPVGKGLTKKMLSTERTLIPRVVDALRSLHRHEPVYIHGDARISNLVLLPDDQSLVWIDLVDGCSACDNSRPSLFAMDMSTLMSSMLDRSFALGVKTHSDGYGRDPESQVARINEFLLQNFSYDA